MITWNNTAEHGYPVALKCVLVWWCDDALPAFISKDRIPNEWLVMHGDGDDEILPLEKITHWSEVNAPA